MTALKITVTAAGRAALSNASHDGTAPTKITSVGVTATSFTPLPTTAVIPGEIKRISTISGGAVAADTLHVTIRDDSTDRYSVRGIGLYLTDGTLFAVYSQANDLLQKSSQATMLLAGDVQFADIDAASLTFGDTNFQMSLATTDVAGVVKLASDAATITGTDPQLVVTPKSLMAALNDRLGAGAPSSFVKTLLNKVSALAFVTALGIRGAASYDTGSNNGLDADLLDDQHGAYYLDYRNLTSVPATFTPAPHQHSAGDIISGTLVVARGGTGAGTFTAGNYLVGNGAGALAERTPAQVLANIGAAAVVHSHPISDINGLQPALDARPLQTNVTAQITAAVNALINGSPGALDTLKELADAMGDDPNFAATMTNALAGKASLAGAAFSGAVSAPTMSTINYLFGADANALIYLAGPGAVGIRSAGGYFSFDAAGNFNALNGSITTVGGLTVGQRIISSTSVLALSPAAAGTVALRPNAGTTTGQLSVDSTGLTSLVTLAASGAITGASVRATGTVMAAGGFQVG